MTACVLHCIKSSIDILIAWVVIQAVSYMKSPKNTHTHTQSLLTPNSLC